MVPEDTDTSAGDGQARTWADGGDAAAPDGGASSAADGGVAAAAGMGEAQLYRVVRAAVKDALLDVVGTLLLVGIAFVLLAVGTQVLFEAAAAPGVALGLALLAVGIYVGAATLEVIPPVREWV